MFLRVTKYASLLHNNLHDTFYALRTLLLDVSTFLRGEGGGKGRKAFVKSDTSLEVKTDFHHEF